MYKEPDPIDISIPFGSIEDVKSSAPFTGTTTIVYPYLLDQEEEVEVTEEQKKQLERLGELKVSRSEKVNKFAAYFGKAVLIDLSNNKESEITSDTLMRAFASLERDLRANPDESLRDLPPRLLIKTHKRHEKVTASSHSYFSPDAVEYMFGRAFCLVGIDTPSINEPGGDDLIEWQFKDREIVWLVNLDLGRFKGTGRFVLIAVPLIDVEEGPVPARAILVPMD